MKRVILALAILVFAVSPAFGGQQASTPPASQETVVVKKSDLTAEQLAKVSANEVKEELGVYSEYIQMGKGAGIAFAEGLGAVKDVTVELSNTRVGKYIMFLIAWKVMFKDVIGMGDMVLGYLIGPTLLFFGAIVIVWSYRRQCLPRRVLLKKTRIGFMQVTKEYKTLEPNSGDDADGWALAHLVASAGLIAVSCMIMFG